MTLLQSPEPTRTLAAACGLPLSAYRRDHVRSCVVRALRREQLPDLAALVRHIDADATARTRLRRALAVSATGLFRDPNQLRWVDGTVIPFLKAANREVRAWSAGCAAGEEAFTLAMMLEWHRMSDDSEVVGSDILEESLAEGESGVVGGARIPSALRGRVEWDRRDLLSDGPPRNDFNLVLCRNLLSYLTPIAAEVLARTLATSLAYGGVLVLARDERIESPGAHGLEELASYAYRRTA
jgi:chemotaxis protein methyltransferase CheR